MNNQAILTRAAAGDPQARDQAAEIVLRGVGTYLRLAGEVSLERCCGLPAPSARKRIAQAQRDYHLAKAFLQCAGPNRAEDLAGHISDFMSRIWPSWRGLAEPPPSASELRADLHRAVLACPDNFPTSSRQIRRIVGDVGEITTRSIAMKTTAVIESEARIEYHASAGLRAEFATESAYVAFRRAEAAGAISWMTKPAAAMSPALADPAGTPTTRNNHHESLG
jgi:hypothetical protein